jgi:hypothetical protein
LPRNYGWGIRHPTDTIWGFWQPDEKAPVIGDAMSKLLAQYGARLDIVFEDPAYPVSKAGYKMVYYWNQTLYSTISIGHSKHATRTIPNSHTPRRVK